ncbi:MAG TPA: lysophospholipid acyltransferase family protein [Solirubrobacteraceae bacterium]|jgi:1-acyl-sn-glycerol-3-phosphate acyltransferase|nr:lysophospholipid acyltransferase family protein [Solirubrobacteraceae bacterium]
MEVSGDQAWARTPPARVARELILGGVFGAIVFAWSRRRVFGREHLAGLEGPVIFVANHSSHVDTPALLLSLPARWRRRTAVAAAADYFYGSRLLAAAVSLAFGTVPLDRRRQGTEVAHIRRLLDGGWSLVVFAEGTRSRDGRVGRMRSGAAVLAAEHGLPIVPVYISGTRDAMPIGSRWMVRPPGGGRLARYPISVRFGAPIDAAAAGGRSEAMDRVRGFMQACGAETMPDRRPDPDPDADADPPVRRPRDIAPAG